MARKKKDPRANVEDSTKIAEWLKKNKIKRIPANVGGEFVVKSFFAKRKKHPFKKGAPVTKESKANV
jgi:hypothetical protein